MQTKMQLPKKLIDWEAVRIHYWMGSGTPPEQPVLVSNRASPLPSITGSGWGTAGAGMAEWVETSNHLERVARVMGEYATIVANHPDYAAIAHLQFCAIPQYAVTLAPDCYGAIVYQNRELMRPADGARFIWMSFGDGFEAAMKHRIRS